MRYYVIYGIRYSDAFKQGTTVRWSGPFQEVGDAEHDAKRLKDSKRVQWAKVIAE